MIRILIYGKKEPLEVVRILHGVLIFYLTRQIIAVSYGGCLVSVSWHIEMLLRLLNRMLLIQSASGKRKNAERMFKFLLIYRKRYDKILREKLRCLYEDIARTG